MAELGAEGQPFAVHQAGDGQGQRQVQYGAVDQLDGQGAGRKIAAAHRKTLPDRAEGMIQGIGQQRQTEPETDEGGRPQGLDGAGEAGEAGHAVDKGLGTAGQQHQPAQDAGQILEGVGHAHDREGHGVGGVAVDGSGAFRLGGGRRPVGGHDDAALPVDVVVLVDDADEHEHHKEEHKQPGAGVAQGAVPHKEGQHAAGRQQQKALAEKLAAVHRDGVLGIQQTDGQRQPQAGHRPGQGGTHGQAGDGKARRQKGQHQLGERQAEGGHGAAHHPHGQPAQRTAPGGAASGQTAAHGGEQQAQPVNQQCQKQNCHHSVT